MGGSAPATGPGGGAGWLCPCLCHSKEGGGCPCHPIPGPEAVAPPLPLPPLSLKGRGGRQLPGVGAEPGLVWPTLFRGVQARPEAAQGRRRRSHPTSAGDGRAPLSSVRRSQAQGGGGVIIIRNKIIVIM